MSMSESDLADDLLWGVTAIAAYINRNERQTDHAIRSGNLPVKRMGKLIVSSKSATLGFRCMLSLR
jgi:hypothetical protein